MLNCKKHKHFKLFFFLKVFFLYLQRFSKRARAIPARTTAAFSKGANHLQLPLGFTVCLHMGVCACISLPPPSQTLPVFLTLLVNPWLLLTEKTLCATTATPLLNRSTLSFLNCIKFKSRF